MTSHPPTRAAALARLAAFAPRAGRAYAAGRSRIAEGHPHVSGLSPYLRHRAVTEAEVAGAILERHAPDAAEAIVREVIWRTYFKGWLERRPSVWTDYWRDLAAARDRLATEGGLRRGWEDACTGRTGIPPLDAWAGELAATGWLHNQARLWFASIWIHTLRLPWALGADFFLRHLLDGDAASNTLSWRWVAGLHTRGKAYAADAEAIAHATGGAFDARALAAQLARPDEVRALDGPAPPPPGPVPADAPLPRGRIGLLLHEDDLHPGWLLARGLEPAGTAALLATDGRSPLTVARPVRDFARALTEDAVAAMPAPGPVTDDGAEIARWARGFDHVVAPHAPVGALRTRLDGAGIATVRPLRDWDAAAWPHATAGFFTFRRATDAILATIPSDGID